MVAHAKLSASGAHRWINCAGSVAAEAAMPYGNKSSVFAEEGTRAHDLAENALREGVAADTLTDDKDMADFVQVYVDYVRSFKASHMTIEERVDFSDWVPEGFGTADAILIYDNTLHVCDLKYGRGVQVFAEDNPQGLLYALGAYAEYGFALDGVDTIKISIVQPRLDHISEWTVSLDYLMKWAERVSQAAQAALEPDAPLNPGEKQCRFCAAKATCSALMRFTQDAILSDFDDLDLSPANKLTDKQLRMIMEAKPLIEGFLSAVQDHIKAKLDAGETFDGFKLVEGRSVRRWDDETKAADALESLIGDDAYKKSLISPAQAEKVLGKAKKADIQDMIVKPRGAPTLAPESDKRPSINVTADDFEEC